ncbi:MAG TPA: zf-HC2 domain-containing protein [Thermoanaerobaculia bacterium]|nr:zf-HC2 domain-containing protein [Thermoanaerobaculia bacterium]
MRQRHEVYEEWVEMEADGLLTPERRARLEAHAAECARCRDERRALARLGALLRETEVAVEPGFRERVVERLPAAGWEGRHPRTWRLPFAAFALLGGLAAALLGGTSAQLGPEVSVVAALAALGEMARAALLAGAGLLGASWKGVGLAMAELLDSPLDVAALGFLVLCLDLLLISLLRRRRPATASPPERRSTVR